MPPAYRTLDLRRSFLRGDSPVRAVDGVSLTIPEGEFVAVTGPSGCGKTTLLHVLSLIDAGFLGKVEIGGRDVARLSPSEQARVRLSEVGIVFQHFRLLDFLDVRDNVALPHWHLHGSRSRARARAEQLLGDLGMSHRVRSPVRKLSGGEMQRVAVARAMINNPRVVLADEPTGNLDAISAGVVLDLLCGSVREGRTLIVVSHNAEVVERAQRVVRMNFGKLVAEEHEIGREPASRGDAKTERGEGVRTA